MVLREDTPPAFLPDWSQMTELAVCKGLPVLSGAEGSWTPSVLLLLCSILLLGPCALG